MIQENPIRKFRKNAFSHVKQFGSAAWYYPEDLVLGIGISFNRYYDTHSVMQGNWSEVFPALLKVYAGLFVGGTGGLATGSAIGFMANKLSDFGIGTHEQAASIENGSILIATLLGAVIGTGLYHASIGRRERLQKQDSQRRMQRFQ